MNILVVDDSPPVTRTLCSYLRRKGFNTDGLTDSRQVIDKWRQDQPDVVLLDIRMPHVDGYEVAKQIRNEPRGDECLIIAVTGESGPEHELNCAISGIDGQMTKPADLPELVRLISGLSRPA